MIAVLLFHLVIATAPAPNASAAHVAQPVKPPTQACDSRTARYGSSRSDRSFDNSHVTSGYDRTGYDTSGTWPAH